MANPIQFQKMHGLGNDFVVIDAVQQTIDLKSLPVSLMADRHLGIGCDQLLIIERGRKADFYCQILNSDGSQAEQCGNGLRCVARFVLENGLTQRKEFTLETIAGTFPVFIRDFGHIRVTMSQSFIKSENIEVPLPQHNAVVAGQSLSMGNPHFIIQVNSIEDTVPGHLGPAISTHPVFPQGTNVGFMEVVNDEYIRLRTYERGSGETLACGSNACAAVAAGILDGNLKNRVNVEFQKGNLTIEWEGENKPVHMTGPAENVFSGVWPV